MLHKPTVANKLPYIYAQHKDLVGAYAFFDKMKERDPVSWSIMVGGFGRVGDYTNCFGTFRELIRHGAQPDKFTLPCVIRACRDTMGLVMGRLVHCSVLKHGLQLDHFICAALVDMYA